MNTMTQEIFQRFEQVVEKYTSENKIRRRWEDRFKDIAMLLKEEFKDIPISLTIGEVSGHRAGSWTTKIWNDQARVYSSGRQVGKYIFNMYLSMTVNPQPRIIYENGKKVAEYLYKRYLKGVKVQFVVYYKNETYHYDYRNEYFSEDKEKKLIRRATEIIKERRQKQAERLIKQRLEQKKFNDIITNLYVTIEDSIESGNCEPMTKEFAKQVAQKLNAFLPFAISASELIKIRDDIYTRRAILKAYEKKLTRQSC